MSTAWGGVGESRPGVPPHHAADMRKKGPDLHLSWLMGLCVCFLWCRWCGV